MADLIWVSWYATVFRKNSFAESVAEVAPLALRYGATQYSVQINNDDRYKITQMTWVPDKTAWYRYWDGPEMVEFRARNAGRYQIPIVYAWSDELAAGTLDPAVMIEPEPEPEPEPASENGPTRNFV